MGMEHLVWDVWCVGYDSMGYELSKPKLRAELEADLRRFVVMSMVMVSDGCPSPSQDMRGKQDKGR